MNWEEAVEFVRSKQEYQDLIKNAYLDRDLVLNVERFRRSEEWELTLGLIKEFKEGKLRILEIGCGNGIASVSFALLGHEVVAVDPDEGDTVGLGAVRTLKQHYKLDNLKTVSAFAETLSEEKESFDLVYCRQSMHHANDLQSFLLNSMIFLKKNGLFLTIRDHVVLNQQDKKWFLETHPLHSLYGGENAYLASEYETAMSKAGLRVVKKLKYFDSPINYFPVTAERLHQWKYEEPQLLTKKIESRLGFVGKWQLTQWLYRKLIFDPKDLIDENKVPGRMYSYVLVKE